MFILIMIYFHLIIYDTTINNIYIIHGVSHEDFLIVLYPKYRIKKLVYFFFNNN